jgi:hypothetical protein
MNILTLTTLFALTVPAHAAPPTEGASLGYDHLRRPAPDVGIKAPDFTLKTLETNEEVTLSTFIGDRPVALVFGSYT